MHFLSRELSSKSWNPHLDLHVSVCQHHEEIIVGHPILFPQLTDELLVHKIFIFYHFHGLFIIFMWGKGEIKVVMKSHSALPLIWLKKKRENYFSEALFLLHIQCTTNHVWELFIHMTFNYLVFHPNSLWKSVDPRAHALPYSSFVHSFEKSCFFLERSLRFFQYAHTHICKYS